MPFFKKYINIRATLKFAYSSLFVYRPKKGAFMDFQTSIVTCLTKKYCTFQGRASRSEFWFFIFFFWIFIIALEIIVIFIPTNLFQIFYVLRLPLLLPLIAVTTRRLHDGDNSGWWLIIFFIPLGLIVLLVFLALKGTNGENRFGSPPAPRRLGNQ